MAHDGMLIVPGVPPTPRSLGLAMTEPDPPPTATQAPPRTLEEVVASLRRLAVAALDAGEPMAAVRIAGLADQLEAETLRGLPRRPDYRSS